MNQSVFFSLLFLSVYFDVLSIAIVILPDFKSNLKSVEAVTSQIPSTINHISLITQPALESLQRWLQQPSEPQKGGFFLPIQWLQHVTFGGAPVAEILDRALSMTLLFPASILQRNSRKIHNKNFAFLTQIK